MKCTIWKKHGSRWSGILCKNGGELSAIGNLLLEKWTKEEDVDRLIDLGFISSLGPTLNESVSYSRDRGELKRVFLDYTLEKAKATRRAYAPTFCYTWIDGIWHFGLEGQSPLLKTCMEER